MKNKKAFSLIEVILTMVIFAIIFLATISLINFSYINNSLEQERSRACQIVFQQMEETKTKLYSNIETNKQITIWDNGTPYSPEDDTKGQLEVEIRDQKTKQIYTVPPVPAKIVEIEVVLTWSPRRYTNKVFRESICVYQTPYYPKMTEKGNPMDNSEFIKIIRKNAEEFIKVVGKHPEEILSEEFAGDRETLLSNGKPHVFLEEADTIKRIRKILDANERYANGYYLDTVDGRLILGTENLEVAFLITVFLLKMRENERK